MRQRLALGAMLGGSVTFLVSLYFVWIDDAFCFAVSRCVPSHDPYVMTSGWNGYGQIAAVLAIALGAAAVNEKLAKRLPVGQIAIALGIIVVLSVSELWTDAITSTAWSKIELIGLRSGAYIGLAGVGVACAGAALARWGGIARPRRAVAAAGTLITLALIASFVLPALKAPGDSTVSVPIPGHRSFSGFSLIGDSVGFIGVFACFSLLAWHGRRPGPRLATAAAIGTLVAAHLWPLRHAYAHWPYELWLQLACAAGLLVLGLVGGRDLRFRRPSVSELAVVIGSILLLVSLFLPWQSLRLGGSSYYAQRGWSTAELAGVSSLGLLLTLVWAGRFAREFAIGAALYVFTAGLATATFSYPATPLPRGRPLELDFRYGAPLGFAGAALLLGFGLGRLHPNPERRSLARLVPVLAALGLLPFAVTPNALAFADLLDKSNLFRLQSPFVTLGLLGGMVTLLTLSLVQRWLDRPGDHADVVLLPLALLALTVLAVIHDAIVTTTIPVLGETYGKGVSWEGWVSVFLCLLLVACGWVARRGAYPWARTDGSASTTSLATSP